MTTKVVDFLNESGGSNFTETAPRPPVYGEENELQSNGGNSTKSSSSHKSHLSSKSHSSSKSGNSGKGDHSPATTPRKSNLEGTKSGDTLTAHSHSSLCACEESEMGAPLGFEPEGSAANSPPYSENGTPPHLKWAENLNFLLNDSEGVELFQEFMEQEQEGGAEGLVFWFACEGLKRKLGSDSVDNAIANIQKAIYKRYVRGDKVKCISKEVKKEIADKIASKGTVDHCLFDAAQEEVIGYVRQVNYPAFLRSDIYVQYVQNYVDSPKSSHSSGSNSARPVSQSGMLPMVPEDKELETKDLRQPTPLPVINKAPPSVAKKVESPISLRRMKMETVTGSSLYSRSSASSSYPAHVSYAPVSAQDSELQSLSSDALTDDTISVTDSSVDGYPHHLRKKHHRKAMKTLAQQNREFKTGLHTQIIPRTEHAPKDCNVAEKNPKQFAELVIERLNKVVEELENSVKMEEKLRSIGEVDKSEEEKLMTSFAKPSSSSSNNNNNNNNTSSTSIIPLMRSSGMEEETAESILDQHCSRIWASSTHHTPSYSPPDNKSPDRGYRDLRKKATVGSAAAAAMASHSAGGLSSSSNSYNIRGFHKKRDYGSSSLSHDSGIEDRNMILCNTETHRHIHHHHHHHHTSRDSSLKKTVVEIEAHNNCLNSWRGAGASADNASFSEYSNVVGEQHSGSGTGRGRTSTRTKGSSNLRSSKNAVPVTAIVDSNSSNIDSGISVFDKDSLRVPPIWNNASGEKVMKWMLDNDCVQEISATGPDVERSSSSHKRSHRLNQSASTATQSKQNSKWKSSARSASMERGGGGGVLSTWSGGPTSILPSQPFIQDSSMPLPTPPNPTTQLEEAKRRLEPLSRTSTASPAKAKSFTSSAVSKDRSMRPPMGGVNAPLTPHNRSMPSARTVPTDLDTSTAHGPDTTRSSSSRRAPNSAPTSLQPSPSETIIGIYIGQEPIPYRHQLPGRAITLAQIKTLVTKKAPTDKYFFKRDSDEFGDGAGAVFEEICEDSAIVPMWQDKIVVKVVKADS